MTPETSNQIVLQAGQAVVTAGAVMVAYFRAKSKGKAEVRPIAERVAVLESQRAEDAHKIDQINAKQDQTNDKLDKVAIALARVEGKLDHERR